MGVLRSIASCVVARVQRTARRVSDHRYIDGRVILTARLAAPDRYTVIAGGAALPVHEPNTIEAFEGETAVANGELRRDVAYRFRVTRRDGMVGFDERALPISRWTP